MKEFGWTIEYTLGLTYPVFIELYGLVRRARADSAIDEFYYPYLSAKWGKECRESLFSIRGDLFLNADGSSGSRQRQFSDEDLRKAERKLNRILNRRRKQLNTVAQEAV